MAWWNHLLVHPVRICVKVRAVHIGVRPVRPYKASKFSGPQKNQPNRRRPMYSCEARAPEPRSSPRVSPRGDFACLALRILDSEPRGPMAFCILFRFRICDLFSSSRVSTSESTRPLAGSSNFIFSFNQRIAI